MHHCGASPGLRAARDAMKIALGRSLCAASYTYPRQNEPFRRYSQFPLPCLQAFPGRRTIGTLDKMISGRKRANAGRKEGSGGRKKETSQGDCPSDRKHLTGREVERLIEATRAARNEARDRCLLLLMFRHGLRVSEACRLKLDQVDTESRVLHVARLKGGLSTTQPLRADELRTIAGWLKLRARM